MKQKEKAWWKVLFGFASECKGKLSVSVLCAVLSVAGGLAPYLGIYQIIKRFIEKNIDWHAVLIWSGFCIAGYLVKIVCYGISTSLSHTDAYTILESIRKKIADRLMRAPLGAVQSRSIGNIKNIIVDRVESIEPPLAHLIPELSSNVLLSLAVIAALFLMDWRMGLAALVTIPVALIPILIGMKSYDKQYANYMAANDKVNSVIVEYVEGIEVVKTFNQTTDSYGKFVGAVDSFKNSTMAWFQSTWKEMNLGLSILPTTLLGTLPVGIALYLNEALSPQELTLCFLLALGIVGPMLKVMQFIEEIKGMAFAVKDAYEMLHLAELPESAARVAIENTNVKMKNVSFSYTGHQNNSILKNINLDLREGSFTALVGPSGGGKSTIAKLLARFWDVSGGSIEIGGKDIRQIPLKQLSEMISFVSQDNFLFDCSLKENIRLGRPNAADAEVEKAAEAAQCDEFIARLDMGWDTTAGDAGKLLSGGERQRISIARAILKNAPIIILDEATAFTDPENEDKLQRSLMALAKDKTLLVIAHRLSTIQNADQIVVLEKGNIVDIGTQRELLTRCSLYRSMWKAHVGAKNWAVGASESIFSEKEATEYV
ncbi:putative multidrug export ATP-binding/permease protein [Caprobacter fermentans]|uniref:Putative multidrug export ATP-binding/permease protein n=1 Tax=Caproicibacter fermentans TaxID=2576756 RepID=A0A6N8I1R0_9FIRM|nr:putative multidrug export ATP-binding/permease protein [Caproicibacter fermentans]